MTILILIIIIIAIVTIVIIIKNNQQACQVNVVCYGIYNVTYHSYIQYIT